MGVVYAFAVAAAEKAGSPDSANVLALVEPYSAVMIVSLIVPQAPSARSTSGRSGRRCRRQRITRPRWNPNSADRRGPR